MKAEVFRENMFSGKTPQGHLDFRLNRTQCKNECRILSHGVSKILRACRNFGKVNGYGKQKALIHSFPAMGVDVVEMGQIKVFVQESGLKRWFLAVTNMDYLTSNFKVDANFEMFPQNYG